MQRTSEAIRRVLHALENARDDVQNVTKASPDFGLQPAKNRQTGSVLRKLIQQQVGPNINDLVGRLATFSDAAVAVASMLDSFQELPLGQADRIDTTKLEQATDQASQLSASLQKLQATIGTGDKESTERDVAAAAKDVASVLQKCQATVGAWESDLEAAREALAHLKARILGWLTPAAVVLTLILAWGALSQISMAGYAWKWFRGSRCAEK